MAFLAIRIDNSEIAGVIRFIEKAIVAMERERVMAFLDQYYALVSKGQAMEVTAERNGFAAVPSARLIELMEKHEMLDNLPKIGDIHA